METVNASLVVLTLNGGILYVVLILGMLMFLLTLHSDLGISR